MRLKDKVTIITGGASGLGLAMANKFVAEGAIVYIVDLKKAEVAGAKSLIVDVTNNESIEAAVAEILAAEGRIDCLINNAGIIKDALLNKMTDEAWTKVIDVNLTGVFKMTKAVLPSMYEAGVGSIINISSIVGEYGNIGQSNYAATKAGIIGLTYSWAKEFPRKGANIRTNAIAPGYAETEMLAGVPEKIMAQLIAANPLKRLAKPEDIANAAAFLASDEASYINGQVLGVNGGARL